jgi:hypothetical protein
MTEQLISLFGTDERKAKDNAAPRGRVSHGAI